MARDMHTHAMSLHDRRPPIDIHHKPRESVPFTVHQPVSVLPVTTSGHADASAHFVCHAQAALPPVKVDVAFLEVEHSDSNGADLPMPQSNELAVGREHSHDLPLFGLSPFDALHGARKNPRMETLQALFLSSFQI